MASRSPVVPECCIRTTAKTQETFSKTAPVNISNRTSCVVINGYEMRIEKTQETPVKEPRGFPGEISAAVIENPE